MLKEKELTMKIKELITENKKFISVEYFPPKERNDWDNFFKTVEKLKKLNPLFASVTYGAGGSTHKDSLEIVQKLQNDFGLETMAHLTCIGSKKEEISTFLDNLQKAGVSNVLALRGDRPADDNSKETTATFNYASELISFIKSSFPDFGIAAAAYPEGHPEAVSKEKDLEYLKVKTSNGADFAITQLFFDNNLYFEFVKRARAIGINKPIIPGILPVVNLKVIKRILSLCGATIPEYFLKELEIADKNGGASAVQQCGVNFAKKQCQELLAGGAPGLHIYTLNRAETVLELTDGLI